MYEDKTWSELIKAQNQCFTVLFDCERKGTWFLGIALIVGISTFIAILSEGIDLFFGVMEAIAIVSFIKYKSIETLELANRKQAAFIQQELERRSSWDSKIAESRITHTHRSKYYPAETSWTKTPAWAFEIPVSEFIDAKENSVIELRCECEIKKDPPYILLVPEAFLASNLESFYLRDDIQKISLFLSAETATWFRELRGGGGVEFYEFLI
jgi:hypothetical protein